MNQPRESRKPFPDAETQFEGFDNLMPFRVQEILLVSSLYDSFILREDGRLNELLVSESQDLHLQQIPRITHVSSCREALELASDVALINRGRLAYRGERTKEMLDDPSWLYRNYGEA